MPPSTFLVNIYEKPTFRVWYLSRYLVHAIIALSMVAGIQLSLPRSCEICTVHFRSSSDQGPKANKIPLSSVAQSTEDATHPPESGGPSFPRNIYSIESTTLHWGVYSIINSEGWFPMYLRIWNVVRTKKVPESKIRFMYSQKLNCTGLVPNSFFFLIIY
jgi:hypothetical protein